MRKFLWQRIHGSSRKSKEERGATVFLSLCPHAAPMSMNDPLGVGQADAGSFELLHAVQSLKHSKQLGCMFHVKPNAIVTDKDHHFF